MAIDINALWDFSQPEASQQRFTAAMAEANADERLVLQTQIARSYGLRRDFAKARQILAQMEPQLKGAVAEVQVRYFLELGRSFASAAHPKASQTPEAIASARQHFLQAYELAAAARLDYLAIDALHMMPLVDTEADQALAWNEKAVAYMERSDQAEARVWEGSLRNNIGYAKRQKGDYAAALQEFRLSKAAYEKAKRTRNARIADWMIARTYRDQKEYSKALAIQLELERAWDAAGEPDPYVFEELAHLYQALGDLPRAQHYGDKFKAAAQ